MAECISVDKLQAGLCKVRKIRAHQLSKYGLPGKVVRQGERGRDKNTMNRNGQGRNDRSKERLGIDFFPD